MKAQLLGRAFEAWLSKRFKSFKPQPASGATPHYKLDLDSSETQIILSLKLTTKQSFSIKLKDIQEIEDAISGPGGVGGEYIGALVTMFAESEELCYDPREVIVSLRLDDLAKLLSDPRQNVLLSRAESKRKAAQIPAILRKETNNDGN